MECVQMESVKSVGHEKCWGVKGHIWHGCPQADGGLGIGMCRTGVVLGEWICEECVFLRLWCGVMVRDKTFPPVILVGCGRVGCPDN